MLQEEGVGATWKEGDVGRVRKSRPAGLFSVSNTLKPTRGSTLRLLAFCDYSSLGVLSRDVLKATNIYETHTTL
jgi:hypothetical protein